MKSRCLLIVASGLFALGSVGCAAGGGSTAPITVVEAPGGEVSFAGTVHPILKDHCIRCHGPDKKGELSILSYEGVIKGGKSGSFVAKFHRETELFSEGTSKRPTG